jgi:endo-1,4-beta-xylanase
MSDKRLRAGRLIVMVFFAWALWLAHPAPAQDSPYQELRQFRHHHHELFDGKILPDVSSQGGDFMAYWQAYLTSELIDGTGWKFQDPQHLAEYKINKWEREHGWPGFEKWKPMYDTHQIELERQPRQYSDVRLTRTIDKAIDTDRKVSLYFFGKSPTANVIHVAYHRTQPPYRIKWEDYIHLSQSHQQGIERTFTIPRAKPGEYSLSFELGEKPGIVKLTYLSLRDLSDNADRSTVMKDMILNNVHEAERETGGSNEEANVEADVDGRIAAFRRGNLTILALDKAGKPIPNVTVEIKQIRHYFLFGCNLNKLNFDDHSPFQRNYQQRFAELFNYAKIPCFWNAIEPQPGKRDFSKVQAAAKWCVDHNIVTNGYGLVSPFYAPKWVPNDFRVGVGQLRATVTECIRNLSDKIHSWDAVDEMAYAQAQPATNVYRQWLNQVAEVGIVERALLWARAASGERNDTFIVNEINGQFLPKMKQHETLPDGIGLVSGMQNRVVSVKGLWQCLEDTSNYDKPLHITELSVLSGESRPNADYFKTYDDWPSTSFGETQQADYVVKVYKILFSNPKLVSISWRDLSDQGAWMGAPGGLLRRDGTPKPAYNRLMDLIHKQWWTRPDSKVTDDKGGGARFKAVFFGDYSVTAHDGRGHTVKKIITFTPESRAEASIIQFGN